MATGPGPKPPLIVRLSVTLVATILSTVVVVSLGHRGGDDAEPVRTVDSTGSTGSTVTTSIVGDASGITGSSVPVTNPTGGIDDASGSQGIDQSGQQDLNQAERDRCVDLLRNGQGFWTIDVRIDPNVLIQGPELDVASMPLWISGCPAAPPSTPGSPDPQLCTANPQPGYDQMTRGSDVSGADDQNTGGQNTGGQDTGGQGTGGQNTGGHDTEDRSDSRNRSPQLPGQHHDRPAPSISKPPVPNRWGGNFAGLVDEDQVARFDMAKGSNPPPGATYPTNVTVRLDILRLCTQAELEARADLTG